MAKARKKAPDAVVSQGYVDERLNVVQAHDAKNPDFKHFWLTEKTAGKLGGRTDVEVVKDAGDEPIGNGISVLCRRPTDSFEARQKDVEVRSQKLYKAVRKDSGGSPRFIDDPPTKFAEPKSPPKEAE